MNRNWADRHKSRDRFPVRKEEYIKEYKSIRRVGVLVLRKNIKQNRFLMQIKHNRSDRLLLPEKSSGNKRAALLSYPLIVYYSNSFVDSGSYIRDDRPSLHNRECHLCNWSKW